MSISILSPLPSDVLPTLDSLSPPPTPIAKRAHHHFVSNNNNVPMPPFPMFLPESNSVMRPPTINRGMGAAAAEKRQLEMLTSFPSSRVKLSPRASFGSRRNVSSSQPQARDDVNITSMIQEDQLPLIPILYTDNTIIESSMMMHTMHLSPVSKVKHPVPASALSPNKKPGHPARLQPKLQPFQRSGMHRRTANRRNSLAAKSA